MSALCLGLGISDRCQLGKRSQRGQLRSSSPAIPTSCWATRTGTARNQRCPFLFRSSQDVHPLNTSFGQGHLNKTKCLLLCKSISYPFFPGDFKFFSPGGSEPHPSSQQQRDSAAAPAWCDSLPAGCCSSCKISTRNLKLRLTFVIVLVLKLCNGPDSIFRKIWYP